MHTKPLNYRAFQLEQLLEITRQLSAMLELEPLLQSIIKITTELTDSQEASILLFEPENNQLRFVAALWFKHELMGQLTVPLEGSIVGEAFRTRKPVRVENVQSDPRHYRLVDEASDFQTRSMLAVPMIFKGEPTGVLTAVNKLGNQTYTTDDVMFMEVLAAQAAIAINNATLLEETRQAYAELAELDRMKTDFIAITSHELRTPLGIILGHASFLKPVVDEEIFPQIEAIERGALRLKDIVEDLSKVKDFQSGDFDVSHRAVDICQVVKEVATTFAPQAKAKRVKLSTKLPEGKLIVEGDEEKIASALGHIVKNAVTFTDSGDAIEINAEKLPEYVIINVIDSGIGIPKKDIDRIFERFYQIEAHMTRRHGGMGLGLSVAKIMVESHGGRITVESVESKGSKFSILLPITQHS